MRLKKYCTSLRLGILTLIAGAYAAFPSLAATDKGASAPQVSGTVTLEEFRRLALDNNRQMMMARERIRKAEYQNKEAFAAYLPGIDFTGRYWSESNIEIFF